MPHPIFRSIFIRIVLRLLILVINCYCWLCMSDRRTVCVEWSRVCCSHSSWAEFHAASDTQNDRSVHVCL